MSVNITTIAYLRVLIIEIGSTIILMVVEAQGFVMLVMHLKILEFCVFFEGFTMVLDFLGLVELPLKCRSERQREEFLREEWALASVPSPSPHPMPFW